MADLEKLKELVFESDNEACFIERERILGRLEEEMRDYSEPDKYALILSKLLSEVSVPVMECDYFAGRAVEAKPDENMQAPNYILYSIGHMSLNYRDLLKFGLKGILEKIKQSKSNDQDSVIFANNAEIAVDAVKKFAERYCESAKAIGNTRMAEALSKVPYEPAYDFYSALQSIWIIHFIASCYIGSRDYAFGRFDEYMYPYYKKALESGESKEYLTELLAGFFMKTNEICGRATHNYKCKPILSQASKQYINIGGENPNEFSNVVLDADLMSNMAQPQITVLLKADANADFTNKVFYAMSILVDKLHIYNYDLIVKSLINKGIDEEIAKDFTYSACCTFDLNYHSYRLEYYTPVPQIFLKVLKENTFYSLEELKSAFTKALTADIQNYVNTCEDNFTNKEYAWQQFVLDGLLLTDSACKCRYACDGNADYTVFNIFCPGVATIGDSLMVLDKLVFKDKRIKYRDFIRILDDNFEGNEQLRNEILSYTKFGNDTDADEYTVMAGNIFNDAVDNLLLKENRYAIGGFYSLERDNVWKDSVGATPDGRKACEPFSENQSPVYGTDKSGITALLKSVAKLPFAKTATGGLNVTFSKNVSPEILKSLILTYFQLGGFHIGISVVDADTLKDAMVHPEKYRSLTVRLYGFSEYFVSLPEWQQIAVLKRTAYGN